MLRILFGKQYKKMIKSRWNNYLPKHLTAKQIQGKLMERENKIFKVSLKSFGIWKTQGWW